MCHRDPHPDRTLAREKTPDRRGERADARHATRVIEHYLATLILPVVQDFGADQQDQQLQHEVRTHGGVSRGRQRVSVGRVALPADITHGIASSIDLPCYDRVEILDLLSTSSF